MRRDRNKQSRAAARKIRDEVLAYAAKTSQREAASHFRVSYNTVRTWAKKARDKAGAVEDPEDTLDVPEVVGLDVGPLVARTEHAFSAHQETSLVARPVEVEIGDALIACCKRIRRAAETAPVKDVIAATKILGEIVLAANLTGTPMGVAVAKAAEKVDPS